MRCPDSRDQILQELACRMRQVESSTRPASSNNDRLSTGIEPLDRLLGRSRSASGVSGQPIASDRQPLPAAGDTGRRLSPHEGLIPGTLVEWLAKGSGSGAQWLALKAVAGVCRPVDSAHLPKIPHLANIGGALVVIDPRGEFYPPAAAGLQLSLDRVLVIRPRRAADTLWALEQALRCPGVAATLCPLERAGDRTFRRLQLAAEAGGGLGLLLRPARAARDPCWADVRLLVQPLSAAGSSCDARHATEGRPQGSIARGLRGGPAAGCTRKVRIEILHVRAGIGGGAVELEIDDETNTVSVAPALAAPTAMPRAARA